MNDDIVDRQQRFPQQPAGATWEPLNASTAQAVPHGKGVPARLAYGVNETAQMLGISEKSVRRLIARGLLRTSKALRHLLISKKEIERFLDETSPQ